MHFRNMIIRCVIFTDLDFEKCVKYIPLFRQNPLQATFTQYFNNYNSV